MSASSMSIRPYNSEFCKGKKFGLWEKQIVRIRGYKSREDLKWWLNYMNLCPSLIRSNPDLIIYSRLSITRIRTGNQKSFE